MKSLWDILRIRLCALAAARWIVVISRMRLSSRGLE